MSLGCMAFKHKILLEKGMEIKYLTKKIANDLSKNIKKYYTKELNPYFDKIYKTKHGFQNVHHAKQNM